MSGKRVPGGRGFLRRRASTIFFMVVATSTLSAAAGALEETPHRAVVAGELEVAAQPAPSLDQPAFVGQSNALWGQGARAAAVALAVSELEALRRAERFEEAQSALAWLERELATQAPVLALEARLLAGTQRYDDSLRLWQELLDRPAAQAGWCVDAALVAWELGRPELAEEYLSRVLSVSGNDSGAAGGPVDPTLEAELLLGRILLWEGRFPEAVGWLRRAKGKGGGLVAYLEAARSLEGWLNMHEAGTEPGQETAAGRGVRGVAAPVPTWPDVVAAFDEVVAMAPQHAEAWLGLYRARLRAGDLEAAALARQRYEELYREDQERIRERGRLAAALNEARLLRAHDPRRALAVLDQLAPVDAVLEERSRCHEALGDLAAAARDLQRAIALSPRRTDLQLRLQDLLRRQLER